MPNKIFFMYNDIGTDISFNKKKIESVEQSDVASYGVTIERTIRFLLLQSLCTKKKTTKKTKAKSKILRWEKDRGRITQLGVKKKSERIECSRERERET